MVAISTRDAESVVAKPGPYSIFLIFGPDAGLVRERADALTASAVDDIKDPFSLVKLEGDDLAVEPSRLVDEAMTVPLFGGRRAIRVRAGGRNFSSGVDVLLSEPLKDCRIIIEAGDMRRDSPLRVMCEKAKTAAVIGCYPDSAKDISQLIDDELRTAGLRIAADARAALIDLLGGDRQASRNEIRKLALYAHGAAEITLDDVAAIVTDASMLALDPIIDNVFAGKPTDFETVFSRAVAGGTNPNTIMFAVQRQAALLHKASLSIEAGQSVESISERGFPRLHFSRKPLVQQALRNLSSERLARIIQQLAQAAFDVRRQPLLAEATMQRALMSIAVNARGRGSAAI